MKYIMAFLLLGAACLHAVENEEVRKIVDRYVQASGGEKFKQVESLKASGELELVGVGIKGSFKVYSKTPDKYRLELMIPGFGKQVSGCDSETAWDVNQILGERMLQGKEKKYAQIMSRFDVIIKFEDYFDKVTIKPDATSVNGKDCKVVEFKAEGLEPFTYYFDKKTGLLAQQTGVLEGPQGKAHVTNSFDEYREIDGVLTPSRMTYHVAQMKFALTMSKLELNVLVRDELFVFPADLKMNLQVAADFSVLLNGEAIEQNEIQPFLQELTGILPKWQFETVTVRFAKALNKPYRSLIPLVDIVMPFTESILLQKGDN